MTSSPSMRHVGFLVYNERFTSSWFGRTTMFIFIPESVIYLLMRELVCVLIPWVLHHPESVRCKWNVQNHEWIFRWMRTHHDKRVRWQWIIVLRRRAVLWGYCASGACSEYRLSVLWLSWSSAWVIDIDEKWYSSDHGKCSQFFCVF